MENNVIGKELRSTHDLAINSEKQEVNSCIMIFIISNCSSYYFLSVCLSYTSFLAFSFFIYSHIREFVEGYILTVDQVITSDRHVHGIVKKKSNNFASQSWYSFALLKALFIYW